MLEAGSFLERYQGAIRAYARSFPDPDCFRDRDVLVIGAGRGADVLHLGHDRGDRRVIAVDIDADLCRFSRRMLEDHGIANASILCADMASVPAIPSGSIDHVVSIATSEHIRDLQGALIESHRVLRPGGRPCPTSPPREHSVHAATRIDPLDAHLALSEGHRSPSNARWAVTTSPGRTAFPHPPRGFCSSDQFRQVVSTTGRPLNALESQRTGSPRLRAEHYPVKRWIGCHLGARRALIPDPPKRKVNPPLLSEPNHLNDEWHDVAFLSHCARTAPIITNDHQHRAIHINTTPLPFNASFTKHIDAQGLVRVSRAPAASTFHDCQYNRAQHHG